MLTLREHRSEIVAAPEAKRLGLSDRKLR